MTPPAPAAADRSAPKRRPSAGVVAAGLVAIIVGIVMLPTSLRTLAVALARSSYVSDQLRLASFEDPVGQSVTDASVSGHIVSSGEPFRTERVSLVGLDRLREMSRTGRIEGQVVPVYYLPAGGFWSSVDIGLGYRVLSPEEFGRGVPLGYLAVNLAFALAGAWLLRRGAGF